MEELLENWLSVDNPDASQRVLERLETLSGFPEPYTRNDPRMVKRWSRRRSELLIKEDLRDLTNLKMLSLVENLAILLTSRVGSQLSVNSLREELQVAHDTTSSWLNALDLVYHSFRLSPYSGKVARGLRKEQKLYLWDLSEVEDPAARFENLVALHLLKAVNTWSDIGFGDFGLFYLRDKDKNEVDFVITERRRPQILIECKLKDDVPAKSLIKLGASFPDIPLIQLIRVEGANELRGRVRVVSANRFLGALV